MVHRHGWRAVISGLLALALAGMLLAHVSASPTSAGTIVYVRPGGSGLQTGASWADARDGQAALLAASSGQELWFAQGTYTPTRGTDRTISFQLKTGVAIYGGFAGTETLRSQRNVATNVTILSGDIGTPNDASDNSYHVVNGSVTDATAILDGVTIMGGNAGGDRSNGGPTYYGGGVYNANGSPTLANVTITGNIGGNYGGGGGGMYNSNSSPTLTNVTISSNTTGQITSGVGGGMYNGNNSNPVLTNVTFTGNTAGADGGGVYNDTSSPVLRSVTISGNNAGYDAAGGGMYNGNNSNPVLTNVTFTGNTAVDGGGMANKNSNPTLSNVTFTGNTASGGGGITNFSSNPTLTNVTIRGNTAGGGGGGLADLLGSNPVLTNVTITGNTATNGGGVYNSTSSNPMLRNVTISGNMADRYGYGGSGGGMYNEFKGTATIRNSIIWGNTNGIVNASGGSADVQSSDVQGTAMYTGTRNLNVDPQFVAPQPPSAVATSAGDYHLHATSPVIDQGNNTFVPPDVTTDRDGKRRIVGPAVDLGAYEVQVRITDGPPPDGSVNQPYRFTFTAAATGTISWTVTSGSLPPGLTLNADTGEVAGTPSVVGSFGPITVQASTADGSDTQTFTLVIAGSPTTTPTSTPTTTVTARPTSTATTPAMLTTTPGMGSTATATPTGTPGHTTVIYLPIVTRGG